MKFCRLNAAAIARFAAFSSAQFINRRLGNANNAGRLNKLIVISGSGAVSRNLLTVLLGWEAGKVFVNGPIMISLTVQYRLRSWFFSVQ